MSRPKPKLKGQSSKGKLQIGGLCALATCTATRAVLLLSGFALLCGLLSCQRPPAPQVVVPTSPIAGTPTLTTPLLQAGEAGRGLTVVTHPLTATSTPTPSPAVIMPTSTPSPTATPAIRLALAAGLPPTIGEAARAWAAGQGVVIVEDAAADLRLDLDPEPDGRLVSERLYVPVQRFATLREEVTLDELRQSWTGTGGFARLLLSEATAADLAALWGPPGEGIQLLPDDELTEALWQDEQAVAIMPFERLEPRLRALRLDGLSAVDNRLAQSEWPLAVRVWLHGAHAEAEGLLTRLQEGVPATNRDPARLTVLVMTGVTAMARMTAWKMEVYQDYAYLAHIIGPELAAADITHISNEVPFVPGCAADPTLNNIVLCSRPEYLAVLDEVGADIVGLTGNHQNDFGHEAMLQSLEIYAGHGLPVYGGGANDEEARRPLLITHNGNRLAFLGANEFGPAEAWATADSPGSARFDLETMQADIAAVRPQADVVLVELQYTEFNDQGDYQTEPLPRQRADFQALSAAGADIVTGVQAHQPQALEFTADGIILYGLGNLFFDQMWWEARQGLIARHAIYEGRHISTELLVTILEDWAQPRWATPAEREEVLRTVFAASGW